MQKLFNKILVPVDFSSRSKPAIEKAISIAEEYKCNIHLLHVVQPDPFLALVKSEFDLTIPMGIIGNRKELEFQLEKLCNYIRFHVNDTFKVETSLLSGAWNETVVDYVNTYAIDLVLIGQKERTFRKRNMVLNPDYISEKTDIPVITIPYNRRLTRLYSIVIPITDFLPVRKLLYAIYIACRYETTIKLLGIENDGTKEKVGHYLARANQLIRSHSKINTIMETIKSQNVAEAINDYSIARSADLIIVNPGAQTKMPGYLSSLLGNILQKYSAPPVLTVNPVR